MLSREELIKRGARLKDGRKLEEIISTVEESAPVVEAQKIDTTPIANAVAEMSSVVKEALETQREMIEKLVNAKSKPEIKKPGSWEFKITRDVRGRIETVNAQELI